MSGLTPPQSSAFVGNATGANVGIISVWSPQTVGLPVGASAWLTVRAKALSDDKTDEARTYRDELARLGIVVRDEGGKQYWRRVPAPIEGSPDR